MKQQQQVKREKRSQKDWGSIMRRYARRACSAKEFAEQEGVKLCTLHYHLGKKSYHEQNVKRRTSSANFVPVVPQPVVASERLLSSPSPQTVAIELTSGTRIVISG